MNYKQINIEEAKEIFAKDKSGNRSRQAAGKLAAIGYTSIIEFGGILDWTGEVV